jgi:hypothetical protein
MSAQRISTALDRVFVDWRDWMDGQIDAWSADGQAPYYYEERPNVSLLAGAFWRHQWNCMQDGGIPKTGKHKGYLDLWAWNRGGDVLYIEAKIAWIQRRKRFGRDNACEFRPTKRCWCISWMADTGSADDEPRCPLLKPLHRSARDLGLLDAEPDGAVHKVALAFVVPYVPVREDARPNGDATEGDATRNVKDLADCTDRLVRYRRVHHMARSFVAGKSVLCTEWNGDQSRYSGIALLARVLRRRG